MPSEPISYRPVTLQDGPAIKELFYYAIYIPPNKPEPDKSIVDTPILTKYWQDWGKVTDLGILAHTDAQTVGAAWLRLLTGENKGYGHVDDHTPELTIAMLPAYRNQGIGGQLLSQIEKEAISLYQRISLSVSKGNPAIHLYKRHGFVQVAENEQDIIMVKVL